MDKNTLEKYKIDIFNVKDDKKFHPIEAQHNNSHLKRVDVFTADQCKRIEDTLDKMDSLWINRSCTPRFAYENSTKSIRAPFWTLGAVSYLDAVEDYARYHKLKTVMNPVLKKKFGWMYDIICEKFEEEFGCPVVIDDVLAHPGFHIFSAKKGQIISEGHVRLFETALGSIHVDIQYKEHWEYWQTYNHADLDNQMTWTIPVKLPKHGGGLYTWDVEVDPAVFNYNTNENKKPDVSPTANKYYEGQMTYFFRHLLHQMMPGVKVSPDDRRLTVQGHGIKCDGVWRLYF